MNSTKLPGFGMDVMPGVASVSVNNGLHEMQVFSAGSGSGGGDPSLSGALSDQDHLGTGDSNLDSATPFINALGMEQNGNGHEESSLQDSGSHYIQHYLSDDANGNSFGPEMTLNNPSLVNAVANFSGNQLYQNVPSNYSFDSDLQATAVSQALTTIQGHGPLGTQANSNPGMPQLVSINGITFLIPSASTGTHPQVDHVTLKAISSDLGLDVNHRLSASSLESQTGAANAHGPAQDEDKFKATFRWLLQNYETAEGVSLPRSTLYNHYEKHCKEANLEPVNAASFGKLIRSVFLGLRTRRIGTRGNSKYHYYGIRLQATDDPNPIVIDPNLLNIFANFYHTHCNLVFDAIVALNFSSLEQLWSKFWRPLGYAHSKRDENSVDSTHSESVDEEEEDEPDDKNDIIKSQLKDLVKSRQVQKFVEKADFALYQKLVNFLIPEVLGVIPNALTQAIRNFAKNLEGWMMVAVKPAPGDFKTIKITTVKSLSQTLRRYTGLNHLAQAARAVLQDSTRISQMSSDLNRVDIANVQEQASWVCQCDADIVATLEKEFKETLQDQATLEKWTEWLSSIVDKTLGPKRDKPDFPKAARQFLLRWSYYSSMVVRDLTLRSAESFGSFHLIRLLYDEYMFYEVQQRVAKALSLSPVAVMALGKIDPVDDSSPRPSVEEHPITSSVGTN
eukprot:maker-scaffold531_size145796-snap-gene-0.20 protein:Tk12602 transcript:maker-scaffold531_size145796-snap-gene-0.20-mRNA-1 annotation:"transcription factor rfx3"